MKIYLAVFFSYFCITLQGSLLVPLPYKKDTTEKPSNALVKQKTNGKYLEFKPYAEGPSVKCNEYSNFEIWMEKWEGHSSCLQKVHWNQVDKVIVYFDQFVDRSKSWTENSTVWPAYLIYHGQAQWIFNFTSKVWPYITKSYGLFGGNSNIHLLIHGNQIRSTPRNPYFHYSLENSEDQDKNRNILDLSSATNNSWISNLTRNSEMDLIINQTFFFVEKKFKGCLGLPSSDLEKYNSSLLSAWTDAFTINVYININMTAHAQRYFKNILQKDKTNTENTQFQNRFYPIHTSNDECKSLVPPYFQVIQDDIVRTNAAHPNANLNLGEFVLIWSGATQTDLRQLAHNAIGWDDTYEKEFENASQKFPKLSGLFNTVFCNS